MEVPCLGVPLEARPLAYGPDAGRAGSELHLPPKPQFMAMPDT